MFYNILIPSAIPCGEIYKGKNSRLEKWQVGELQSRDAAARDKD